MKLTIIVFIFACLLGCKARQFNQETSHVLDATQGVADPIACPNGKVFAFSLANECNSKLSLNDMTAKRHAPGTTDLVATSREACMYQKLILTAQT